LGYSKKLIIFSFTLDLLSINQYYMSQSNSNALSFYQTKSKTQVKQKQVEHKTLDQQSLSHQDWKPVVLSKPIKTTQKLIQIDPNFKKMVQIEQESVNGNFTIEKISEDDKKYVCSLRILKKLSQDDLAKKLNIRKEIIRDIENGTHPKDNQLIARIKRILNALPTPTNV